MKIATETAAVPPPDDVARDLLNTISGSSYDEAKRRELFQASLVSMFPNHGWKIRRFALGAETHVKMKIGEAVKLGRIDTLHGSLIVEYKRKLSSAQDVAEATQQAREYVAGIIAEEQDADAVRRILVTDIESWYEYDVTFGGDSKDPVADDVTLSLRSEKSFSPGEADDFLVYLDAALWQERVVATPEVLATGFGVGSSFHGPVTAALEKAWDAKRTDPEYSLLLDLWHEHVASCYGKGATKDTAAYLAHAYLVLLSRVFAGFALAESEERSRAGFLDRCIDGSFFRSKRLIDFVEEDFFRWLAADGTLSILQPAMKKLHAGLEAVDFHRAAHFDLLSGLYESIMPVDLRKEFGEVFTPSWLADEIVQDLPNVAKKGCRVLDPACGPGSFLRAAVEAKISERQDDNRQDVLTDVLSEIAGFDVNPVSISMAKATLAMALAELIQDADAPVRLPIYLADSLFNPGPATRNKRATLITFDPEEKVEVEVPDALLRVHGAFDATITFCQDQATLLANGDINGPDSDELLSKHVGEIAANLELVESDVGLLSESTGKVRDALLARKKARRNNIWGFVLKHAYRPTLLSASFDVLVTNPPWLTLSNLPAARYKQQLEDLASTYDLRPKGESAHHLEIATIFAVHAVERYLRPGGEFGIILPHTLINANQHAPLRDSKFLSQAKITVTRLWDFGEAKDLFKRLACVLFGVKETSKQKARGMPDEIPTVVWGYT